MLNGLHCWLAKGFIVEIKRITRETHHTWAYLRFASAVGNRGGAKRWNQNEGLAEFWRENSLKMVICESIQD